MEKSFEFDDAISRKDIQDYIAEYLSQYLYEDVRQAVEVIDAYIGDMPSVTQKSETVTEFADRCRECGARYGKLLKQKSCEDAISRQVVEEIINDIRDCISVEGYWAIIERLKKLPSVTQKSGKWIPVGERLPKKEGRYLTTILNEHDNRLRYVMTCDYFSNGCWCPDDECASSNVIAWMPLPPCFEPQESEE